MAEERVIQDQSPDFLVALEQALVAAQHFPESTYRVQFHAGFTFRDALHIVPYLHDLLNIHQSETLVRLVARACRIEEDLGEKEKRGVLKSMQTRAEFLSDVSHRIRFLYTPKHTSWLNQIEMWFSILVRRLLKRGNFTSVEDLRERILAFINYFNRTMAKPFKWTYTGRPLTA